MAQITRTKGEHALHRSRSSAGMDPEQQIEIARVAERSPRQKGTTHQFAANKARGAGRTDEGANAGELELEEVEPGEVSEEESNQTREEARRAHGPERAHSR